MPIKWRSNVAERFWNDCMMDQMPSSPAIACDFFPSLKGVNMQMYDAYNHGIRGGIITADELDAAACEGAKLAALLRRVDPSIDDFETSWDVIERE